MMSMTGLDKDIFRATRHLTTLLNEACNHWNYLCPYLEKLGGAADKALDGYRKDYPSDVATIIAEDRKSAIRPSRNCDVGTPQEQRRRYDEWRNQDELRAAFGKDEFAWAQMPYEEGEVAK